MQSFDNIGYSIEHYLLEHKEKTNISRFDLFIFYIWF